MSLTLTNTLSAATDKQGDFMFDLGFIGVGNMGGALLNAALKKCNANKIIIADHNQEKAKETAKNTGCRFGNNQDVINGAKFIFLGVKPQVMKDMLSSLKSVLEQRKDRFVLVSMAAGLSLADIKEFAGVDLPIIRIMPNTPVAVSSGMILYCKNELVTENEMNEFLSLMSEAGAFADLDESLFDAGCALSGCGPAFVYMFINALIEGAIECGLNSEQAKLLANNTVIGAAKMALASNSSPQTLRDNVCSPGGCTIEGVYKLEDGRFEDTVKNAVKAAYEKSKILGK